MPFDRAQLEQLEAAALLHRLHDALVSGELWHLNYESDLYRVTVTRELRGGQSCGCDPKAGWVCERHQLERDKQP